MMSSAGPFYAGVKHFFFSLDDALAALAMGLIAGLRKDESGNWTVVALPAAWLASGVAALFLCSSPIAGDAASAVSLMVLGVVVALDRRLSLGVFVLLAAGAGALHGFLNGSAMREVGLKPGFWQLIGASGSALFVVIYPRALLDLIKQPWIRIVVRVLGSWIAAIGLLLLGWSLRAGRVPGP